MNKLNIALAASILINILFVVLLAIYLVTPVLDWVAIKKSGPSFCEHLQGTDNASFDSEEIASFCEIMVNLGN